jgi:trigger factor
MSSQDDEATTVDVEETEAGDDTLVAMPQAYKMSLSVEIESAGPCRKHVQVTVPRADLDHFHTEAIGELSTSVDVPGFRKGHVPTKLVEKRFRKEVGDQVKQNVLVGSMEQVSEEHDLDPINEPDLDVENLEIPEEGDFVYEFDVEVRPDFELPSYDGLKIDRIAKETTDADVEAYLERYLAQYGELIPHEGAAEKGDFVVLNIEFQHNGSHLHDLKELTVELKPVLRFQDAELDGFDELLIGANADDKREAELTISTETETLAMRGETVQAEIEVLDVKRLRRPELDKEFLSRVGVETEDELKDEIRDMLERQATYQQRQSTREQVLAKITESADWDLPEQMVLRQTDNALRREMLEMQQAGFTTQDIQARENELRQNAVSTTRQALKEHFVLDKIAAEENIECEMGDIDTEIRMMAMQAGESPRRLRARMLKSGMIDNLDAQIRERKAIDFILEKAEFVDVEAEKSTEDRVEAVPQSVCGIKTQSMNASESQAVETESAASEATEPEADDAGE